MRSVVVTVERLYVGVDLRHCHMALPLSITWNWDGVRYFALFQALQDRRERLREQSSANGGTCAILNKNQKSVNLVNLL